jgi:hypothetical protein
MQDDMQEERSDELRKGLKCSDRLQIYFRDGRNERKNNKTGPVKQHSRPSETKDEAKSLTT